MPHQNLLQASPVTTANIHQLYSVPILRYTSENTEIEVAYNGNRNIYSCHSHLECLNFLWVLCHNGPYRCAILLVSPGVGIVQRIIRLTGMRELVSRDEIVVKIVDIFEPLVVPTRSVNSHAGLQQYEWYFFGLHG